MVLTKAWECPRCHGEFIVTSNAERDVCPWCKTTVQEKDGALVQAASPAQAEKPSQPETETPTSVGAPKNGGPVATQPEQSGNDVWWPYEYDPF